MWRLLNKDKKQYTYIPNDNQRSSVRIDYILTSTYLQHFITKAEIIAAPVLDHKAILIVIQGTGKKRGPGFWKLNSTVLHDELYVSEIKNIFSDTLEEYMCCNKRDIWDMCKIRFKDYTIRYCTSKRQHSRDDCKEIEDGISKIDELISKKRKNDRDIISLKISRDLLKCKYDLHIRQRASGAQIRSRAKWLEAKHILFFKT